ncbi:hypothetical protein UPYG_G00178040 [Umbra pygmaea]|uniref:Fibronectin type-III domain-containing protein n=1 Tax=Umbra pygmaea TaxID=75934 RepID=A0ABD0XB04_UMBPY
MMFCANWILPASLRTSLPENQERKNDKAPSKPPDVCYNVEKVNKEGPHHLMLLWKALDFQDANGLVIGYQVSYRQINHPFLSGTTNTTGLKTVFEVTEDGLEVSVMAYNSAGGSPKYHLMIDQSIHQMLPPVRRLWVNSEEDGLLLQWDIGHISLPVNEVAIEWATNSTHPTTSHWKRVNGSSRSTVLKDNLQPWTIYIVNVYPISYQLCGPPISIYADLKHGALLGVAQLHIEHVTINTVTVQWQWQQMEVLPKVLQYRILLMLGKIPVESFPVWPDVRQHTFFKLLANKDYSIHLVVETSNDNISREIITIKNSDVEASDKNIVTTCLIALLIITIGLFFILYKTV